ncbi:SixA phosphatase family protein [Limimaricola pyoseonensis]|uniref:Phosphohistidine phosphatase n=1 Tax=Limimaricola pyoseonensis TaxID=521013 RepID=A0A1G7KXV7_9RHOB|nr:histidine phosphatase family protein [Limimaricola pyoseonensis]SDF41924.1 phosphohistidine phosphatase [Limimaricola pyoseonensis]
MRRLVLIRHAKSDWGDEGTRDHDRHLAERGRHDAPRMGAWLQAQGLVPGLVLCSTATRTRETLALMLPEWAEQPQVEHRAELYAAAPATLLKAARESGAESVALVAHNPGIGALAAQMAVAAPEHPKFRRYPTAAITVLEFDEAMAAGRGRVLAFAVPKDL